MAPLALYYLETSPIGGAARPRRSRGATREPPHVKALHHAPMAMGRDQQENAQTLKGHDVAMWPILTQLGCRYVQQASRDDSGRRAGTWCVLGPGGPPQRRSVSPAQSPLELLSITRYYTDSWGA